MKWFISLFLGFLTNNGVIGRAFDTIDHSMDNETKRQELKYNFINRQLAISAETTIADKWMHFARASFWIGTAIYWNAILADSLFHFDWDVAAIPAPYDTWGFAIVGALFAVDLGLQRIVRGIRR